MREPLASARKRRTSAQVATPLAALLGLVILVAGAEHVAAQDEPEPAPEAAPDADAPAGAVSAELSIDDRVAAALLSRGQILFDSGDFANAKKLFIESLERSGEGPSSERALTMLRSSNEQLGISDLNDGRPPRDGTAPLDPYAGAETPVDPYASTEKPADPYASIDPASDVVDGDEPNRQTSRGLMAWGAGYGFSLGMAIGGPVDSDTDRVKGGALLLGLVGIGGGIAGGYFGSRRYALSRGQVAALASAGNWGMYSVGMLGDVLTGEGTSANEVYKFVAAGGAIGMGAGILYVRSAKPTEGEVAVVNSLGAYGSATGLLFAVMLAPPRADAYSLNAVLGSVGGIGVGLYLKDRFKMSRARTLRIDLGAAVGAGATWALLYPLISDGDTNNDEQFAGFFSIVTMAAGIGGAYYLTRNMDRKKSERLLPEEEPVTAGLIRRAGSGRWSLGSPSLRPMVDPALAPPTGFSLGVDLAAGRF